MPYTIRVQEDPKTDKWHTIRVPGDLEDAKLSVNFLRKAGFECKDPRKISEKKNTPTTGPRIHEMLYLV